MPSVCLYFQVHQPYRLRRYSVFDTDRHYLDDHKNAEILRKVASKGYLPANKLLLETIRAHEGRFRLAFSLSGVVLEQFQQYAPEVLDSFRALADETRREILKLLRDGPRTSGELADRFSSSWPTISRHLAILRDAGLVLTERRGQEIHYELNTSVLQDLVQHLLDWVTPTTPAKAAASSRARAARRREV